MEGISTWLLSIAGVVILSVLAEFVLPEGQINKYTKVIFSFVILFVIIMPLPKIFGKDFNFADYFQSEEGYLQEDYLYQLNINKLTALNEEIAQKIKDAGLNNVEISINANVLCETLEIYDVFVDLSEIRYENNFGSKDVTKAKVKIKEILSQFNLLKDVEVKFNEQI